MVHSRLLHRRQVQGATIASTFSPLDEDKHTSTSSLISYPLPGSFLTFGERSLTKPQSLKATLSILNKIEFLSITRSANLSSQEENSSLVSVIKQWFQDC
ncbi:MAG: hypothetical protein V7K83_31870 [Nostoc sp.]